MIRFHLLRGARDWMGHLILIMLPVILISFFFFIIRQDIAGTEAEAFLPEIAVFLSIGFALTFQIYSTANSYEVLDQDFLTPMRNRLLASPALPVRLVFSILLSGIIVSFLQTLVVLLFTSLAYDAAYGSLPFVLLILLLSMVFHHLLAAVILLWTCSPKKAGAVITLYAIVAPMLLGLYFSMPALRIFELFEKYLLPVSLANTAIKGVMEKSTADVLIGVLPLLALSIALLLLIGPLTRKVVAS